MTQLKNRSDIRSYNLAQLRNIAAAMSQPDFRGDQIYGWLWKKSALSFDSMVNLPKVFREKLKADFIINKLNIDTIETSSDDTIKARFCLYDNKYIEGALIPSSDRVTACISSQAGCSLSCKFCATGYLGFKRNLDASEIYDQVVVLNQQALKEYNKFVTNIVYMGMGEPLLNYKEVMRSIDLITSHYGLHMSSKRITLSTAGIAKMITRLADDNAKFNLALSLHAANDEKRNKIMPINHHNSISSLVPALKYYFAKTKNPVTYEYILFKDFNDNTEDAKELISFCKHIPSKVNIIEYNSIGLTDFNNTSINKLNDFIACLENKNINVRVRQSRGKDINAACGQLANKTK